MVDARLDLGDRHREVRQPVRDVAANHANRERIGIVKGDGLRTLQKPELQRPSIE